MRNVLALTLAPLLLAAPAAAGTPKTYQVTGPVVEVRDDVVVMQKGKEKWEIAKGDAKVADLKTGDRVTVEYRMTAVNIEVKAKKPGAPDKAEAKAEAKADKAEAKADKAEAKADKAEAKAEKAAK